MAAHDLEPGDELAPAMAERLAALASQHLPGMEASFVPPERVRAQIARGRAGVLASVARALDTTPVDEDLDQFLANHWIQVDAHQHKAMRMEGLRAAGEAWLTVAEREDELGKGWTAAPSAVTRAAGRSRQEPALAPRADAMPEVPQTCGAEAVDSSRPRAGEVAATTTAAIVAPAALEAAATAPRGPSVHELVARWGESGKSAGPSAADTDEVRKTTAAKRLRAAELFLEFVGDIPAAALTEAHVQGFMQKLGQLPAGHGKAAAFRGLSAREAVAKADEHDRMNPGAPPIPRLARGTINSYLSAMSPALAGHAPANRKGKMPTEAVRFTKTQVKAKRTFKRKQYNDADMNAFFAGPIYTGHDNSVDRTAPGPFLVRDHMYWTPLLALYGGLCLEEALQLTTNCVEVVDGVAKVSIDPTKMTLKTMTREREIPLHPALLELGFMDHVERMRAAGHDRLFPEARQGGPDRRYGHKESQRFTAYRRAVGINEKGVDFHALRTSFSSTLMNKHQNQAVIADLMGHSQKGMTAEHYGGETELSTKTEALGALSYKAIDTRAMRELAEAAEAAGGVIPGREPPKPDRRRGRRNGTPPAARQRRAP